MNYLIWSNEHGAWWRPGSFGYTSDIAEAGRYGKDEATRICTSFHAPRPEGVAHEVMVLAPEHRWQGGPPERNIITTSA